MVPPASRMIPKVTRVIHGSCMAEVAEDLLKLGSDKGSEHPCNEHKHDPEQPGIGAIEWDRAGAARQRFAALVGEAREDRLEPARFLGCADQANDPRRNLRHNSKRHGQRCALFQLVPRALEVAGKQAGLGLTDRVKHPRQREVQTHGLFDVAKDRSCPLAPHGGVDGQPQRQQDRSAGDHHQKYLYHRARAFVRQPIHHPDQPHEQHDG